MSDQFIVQGRVVWGHPGELKNKKDKNKQNVMKDGQPVMQCAFGIAIDRNTFYSQVLPKLQAEARAAFPGAQAVQPSVQFPGGLTGVPMNFSWKFKDGEVSLDKMGKPMNTREGYAGNCVLTVATQGFAPQLYKHEGNGYRQLQTNEVKCGDFVAVNITVKYNGATGTNTPGLYVNPNAVILLGYGAEIVSAAQDPDELFAGMQTQQFAGMTAQPQMSGAPLPGGMAPAPVAGQPVYAAPVAQPAAPGYVGGPASQPPHGSGGYAAPVAQPGYPAPGAPLPPPDHNFVANATGQPQYAPVPQQPVYTAPVAQPQYAPAPVAGQPVYAAPQPAQNAPIYTAPAAPGYAAPGQYPGAPVGR